jgi:ABC-type uncharacterized transport system involved in gliding motility auxiliary subunit
MVCVLTGVGLGGWWLYRTMERRALNSDTVIAGSEVMALSPGTKAVLRSLHAPVEIRFYSLLDPDTMTEPVQTLANRLEQLLAEYQRQSGGQIQVTRYTSRSDMNAASADGLKPFNLDKGEPCYLGLAVVHAGQQEALPRLSPEWEHALESDLSRVIARLVSASSAVSASAMAPVIDPSTTAEVKRLIPNFMSVSLEEGSRILRETALQDFTTAATEMELQLKEAGQRVSPTGNELSEAERDAAVKYMQRVQAEQAAKLKNIAARSAAQIEALRQLKEAAP